MDGGDAFAAMSLPAGYEVTVAMDLEAGYRPALEALHVRRTGKTPEVFRMGKQSGNVIGFPIHLLPPCDILVAGPPCPPWSSQGVRKGQTDIRSTVFHTVVKWVVQLATRGQLKAVVLENVVGVSSVEFMQILSFSKRFVIC